MGTIHLRAPELDCGSWSETVEISAVMVSETYVTQVGSKQAAFGGAQQTREDENEEGKLRKAPFSILNASTSLKIVCMIIFPVMKPHKSA